MTEQETSSANEGRKNKTETRNFDAVVDQWVVDYFPESVITRDSQGWQLFQQAAAALKQRLRGE